jgi:hypothetical protein
MLLLGQQLDCSGVCEHVCVCVCVCERERERERERDRERFALALFIGSNKQNNTKSNQHQSLQARPIRGFRRGNQSGKKNRTCWCWLACFVLLKRVHARVKIGVAVALGLPWSSMRAPRGFWWNETLQTES